MMPPSGVATTDLLELPAVDTAAACSGAAAGASAGAAASGAGEAGTGVGLGAALLLRTFMNLIKESSWSP